MIHKKITTTLRNGATNLLRKILPTDTAQPSRFRNIHGISDTGLVRKENQDLFLTEPDHNLLLLADGMGGHKGGELASHMAVTNSFRYIADFRKSTGGSGGTEPTPSEVPPELILYRAIETANEAIYAKARGNPALEKMGSTLIIAWLVDTTLHFGHVGDVRGYLFRQNELQQLTRDHTVIATMVAAGRLTPEEARESPYLHQVERAVGPYADVEPEINSIDIERGDRVLLCSDGLWDMVEDAQLAAVLRETRDNKKACQALLKDALANGGKDNVTMVLATI